MYDILSGDFVSSIFSSPPPPFFLIHNNNCFPVPARFYTHQSSFLKQWTLSKQSGSRPHFQTLGLSLCFYIYKPPSSLHPLCCGFLFLKKHRLCLCCLCNQDQGMIYVHPRQLTFAVLMAGPYSNPFVSTLYSVWRGLWISTHSLGLHLLDPHAHAV